MGAGISKPARLTRGELLRLTKDPRDLINRIFQIMIKDITKKEYLDLANPARCSQFVFVMADALAQTFHSLKISPIGNEKGGVLYFVKQSDLLEKKPEIASFHCLSIAYFYIRIFQLFGALALTVVDNPLAGGTIRYLQQQVRPSTKLVPLGAPGQQPIRFTGGKWTTIAPKFLIPYMRELDKSNSITRYEFTRDTNLKLLTDNNKYFLRYESGYSQRPVEVELITQQDDTGFQVSYKIQFRMNSKLSKGTGVREVKGRYYVTIGQDTFSNRQLIEIDEYLIQVLRRAAEGQTLNNGTRRNTIFGRKNNLFSRNGQRTRKNNGFVGVVGAIDPLRTNFIAPGLDDPTKTMPFCVARALQLINVDVIDQLAPPDVTTRICQTTFAPGLGVVPAADKPLTDSPGLYALEQLWYTKAYTQRSQDGKFPTRVDIPEADVTAHKQFLQTMQQLFGDPAKPVANATRLRDIVMGKPKCSADKLGKDLVLRQDPRRVNPNDPIPHMQQVVEMLFKFQNEHTKNVMKFLQTYVFDIKKDSLNLQKKLIEGGVPYLNEITKAARELLTQYYSKCELLYKARFDEFASRGTVV